MIASELLKCYARLFVGRRNDYAVQQADGRYLRAGRPLTYSLLEQHLRGELTLGTYVIDEQGTCRFAVFDADKEDGMRVLVGVQERLRVEGIPSCLEGSRRGGHLWVFCDRLVPASHLRLWLLPFCPAWHVEFYPRQDEGKGYGSLIRLPLGVHRLSGRRYGFFTWQTQPSPHRVPVARSVEEMLAWLSTVERAVVPPLDSLLLQGGTREQDRGTSLAKASERAATGLPSSIQDWCASQDPYSVIGHYIQLDRRGMGCCPFREHHSDGLDSHPSFRVYRPSRPGTSCWYCYTWRKGGTLFDFLLLYHHLDVKTLWQRIRSGESF